MITEKIDKLCKSPYLVANSIYFYEGVAGLVINELHIYDTTFCRKYWEKNAKKWDTAKTFDKKVDVISEFVGAQIAYDIKEKSKNG